MRVVAIPALLLLALAGLAIVPETAAAPPEPPCNGTFAVTRTVGPVTVFASPPCYTVSVDPGCIHDDWHRQTVQRITVEVNVCDGPTPPPTTTASSQPPCTCPPPQCYDVFSEGLLAEVVDVTITRDCRIIVQVLPHLIACADPLDGTKAITVGKVTVTVPCGQIDACEPPFECYPASTSSSSSVLIPPVCIERNVEQGPLTAHAGQCDAQWALLDLCPDWGSPERSIREGIEHQGREFAWVEVKSCTPHSPPPDLSTAAADPGPCGVQQRCPAPVPFCSGVKDPIEGHVDVDVSPNCHVLVTVDVIDCLWGETWNYRSLSPVPVTVGYTTCRDPDPTTTASEQPPCTCPPPQPLCAPVTRALAENQYYSISDDCQVTVTLEAYCGLQGTEQHSVTVGKVTVDYQTCQQPPQQSMADPFPTCVTEPCGPGVPQVPTGCDLQQATPTSVGPTGLNLQRLVWGSDASQCDVDVEPIGACAPPSGKTIEARVAFLHVTLLLCGDVGDVTDGWS